MKVLVSGGTGYIGSHTVVELIALGHEVIIVDNLYNSQIDVLDKIKTITSKHSIQFITTIVKNMMLWILYLVKKA